MGLIWLTPVLAMAAASAPTQREFVIVQRMTFQSAAAEAAIKRQYSAKLNAAYVRIKGQDDELLRLESLVRGGGPQASAARTKSKVLEAQLATQKADFLAVLAAKDSEFARERDRFAAATARILATPDGEKALELFLLKTPETALQAINLLNLAAAREAAMDARAGAVRNTVRLRDIAVQVLNARDNGTVTTAIATKQYEMVTDTGAASHWDWVELSRLYSTQNRSDDALRAAKMAETAAIVGRQRSVALIIMGDILREKNRSREAHDAYADALKIREHIARTEPTSIEAQRDLSLALDSLAQLSEDTGEIKSAFDMYERALKIREGIRDHNQSSAAIRRDISVSAQNIGGIFLSNKQYFAALDYFEYSLRMRQTLLNDNPLSIGAKRDLYVSLMSIGDTYMRLENWTSARKKYEESLELAKLLSDQDSSSLTAVRDTAFSLERVGWAMMKEGNLTGAALSYKSALGIGERLVKADPSLREAQNDVLVYLGRLAFLKEPGFTWQRALDQLHVLESRGLLTDADSNIATTTRTMAAEEAARK